MFHSGFHQTEGQNKYPSQYGALRGPVADNRGYMSLRSISNIADISRCKWHLFMINLYLRQCIISYLYKNFRSVGFFGIHYATPVPAV